MVVPVDRVQGSTLSCSQILAILHAGGLQTYSFYSGDVLLIPYILPLPSCILNTSNEHPVVSKSEVLIKIRASLARIETQATVTGYKMLLDEGKLSTAATDGIKDPETGDYLLKPIPINADSRLSKYRPFQFIYAEYNRDISSRMHELVYMPRSASHPFTSTDRVKLILTILTNTGESSTTITITRTHTVC